MRVTKQDINMANLWQSLGKLTPRNAEIVVEQIEFSKSVNDFQEKTDVATDELCELIHLCKDYHYSVDTKEGHELLFGNQEFDELEMNYNAHIIAVHSFVCKDTTVKHEQSGYFVEFDNGHYCCLAMQSEHYSNSYKDTLQFLKTEWLS